MKRLALFAALGLLSACGDSNGPAPTIAGTWQVALGGLDSGSLAPATFSVVITRVGNDSFSITVPALTWSVGGVQAAVFDSTPIFHTISSPDTGFAFLRTSTSPTTRTQRCQWISLGGYTNAGKDTLSSATLTVVSGDTIAGGYCTIGATGTFTAHK